VSIGRNLNFKNRLNTLKSRGFTLVELLVVISIIAMLLAIMMPALSKAKNRAKQVQCKYNLKQIGTAITMYGGNNSEKYPYGNMWNFPFADSSVDDTPAGASSMSGGKIKYARPFVGNALRQYLQNQIIVFICPAFDMLAANHKEFIEAVKKGVFPQSKVAGTTMMAYNYFGNYPLEMDTDPTFKFRISYKERVDIESGKYPSKTINKRSKLFQDSVTNHWVATNHEMVNSLFTDGSIDAEKENKLTQYFRSVGATDTIDHKALWYKW
jgi:prepilin-type N-terminal cleavage/methylation domain-containing protein